MNILVTGGTGYIGSHTVVELLQRGHTITIVDNLSNSSSSVIDRIATITGKTVPLHVFDVEDEPRLDAVFVDNTFDAVVHFAGLKAVSESVADPLRYFTTNLASSLTLLDRMRNHTVPLLVFSSSATVYGTAPVPYTELSSTGQGIASPYGQTKYMIEQFMRDHSASWPDARYVALRYFNPVGADESGLLGELPNGIPNNLMPYIAQVASGKQKVLSVFGNDYPTVDGTGVRDYVHVVDIAKGHVAALENAKVGFTAYNLGSGKGTSVLQLLHAFEAATGITIPYQISPRRSGDLAEYYADPSKAAQELGWISEKSIEDMCRDTWRWQESLDKQSL